MQSCYEDEVVKIFHGDCLAVLRAMPANSVDSIVTDPPYGLKFMGKKWDYDVPSVEIWAECLRVLKPGGHLLAFAGTRTQHRMAVRIEDAGFEIRDMIAWVYGSGFPKSLDVSKALDEKAGAVREVVGVRDDKGRVSTFGGGETRPSLETAPATEAAKKWEGWGTALKPALEPITLARKPLIGTVAENVLAHGTGGINVDGCRVPIDPAADATQVVKAEGRWPANLIHDGSEEVTGLFPAPHGAGAARTAIRECAPSGNLWKMAGDGQRFGDSGSAARFFMEAKLEDAEWLAQNLNLFHANNAGLSLSPQSVAESIAQSAVVISALPAGTVLSVLRVPSTAATAKELRELATATIGAIQSFGQKCLREWRQEKLSQIGNRVSAVATREPTGITTITIDRWKSDGCAAPVIFGIMPRSAEPGEVESAGRFKYYPKASKADRNAGLDDFETVPNTEIVGRDADSAGINNPRAGAGRTSGAKNPHPTVKPTELMRYLCRLVTPPGGVVLDPFMGSGSTGRAALLEGFGFVGVEREEQYIHVAQARVLSARKEINAACNTDLQATMDL